jgi:hypothetical protein
LFAGSRKVTFANARGANLWPMLSLSYDRTNLPAPPAIPGMDHAGNARESATLLPGADIEDGALRR